MNTPKIAKNVKLDVVHPNFELMFGATESKRASSIMVGDSINNKMGARPQLRRDNESLARKSHIELFIIINIHFCRA